MVCHVVSHVMCHMMDTHQNCASCVVAKWSQNSPLHNEVWEQSNRWNFSDSSNFDTPLKDKPFTNFNTDMYTTCMYNPDKSDAEDKIKDNYVKVVVDICHFLLISRIYKIKDSVYIFILHWF